MILCIEIGNTCTKLGIFDKDDKLVKNYLMNTSKNLTSDEYALRFKNLIGEEFKIDGAIISSVVPKLTVIFKDAVRSVFNVESKVLNKKLKTKIAIKIDNPNELGTDFLCTAIGALKLGYKPPFAIADFGTCTKISVIDQSGSFIGVFITAGIETNMITLSQEADQLYQVEIALPQKIIGKNTKESIQSGLIYGQAFMVDETVRRMEQEVGYPLKRIITGGHSQIIKNVVCGFHHENNLSLIGLNEIYKINCKD